MAERDLSDWGDEGCDEPFPAVLILTSTVDREGGAAVSGMDNSRVLGPKSCWRKALILRLGAAAGPRALASESGHPKKAYEKEIIRQPLGNMMQEVY
jgi:hypothetical protein